MHIESQEFKDVFFLWILYRDQYSLYILFPIYETVLH